MSNTDLDDEIDELALEIEKQIQDAKKTNEKWEGVFDSRYREMNADAEKLFA